MSEGLFVQQDENVYLPSDRAVGPWGPDLLHGGATAGLVSFLLENHEPEDNKQFSRLTLDIFRPVPKIPLTVSTKTIRNGRKVSVIEVSISANGKEVTRATGLKILATETKIPEDRQLPVCPFEGPDAFESLTGFGAGDDADDDQPRPPMGMITTMDIRCLSGFDQSGSGTAWFKTHLPVVTGHQPTPFTRLGLLSDFGNGLAQLAIPGTGSSINADISMYINRLPKDEWICLDSEAMMSETGIGRVSSTLYDEAGAIGSVVQMTMTQVMG